MKQLLSLTTATVVAILTVFMPLRGAVAQTARRQFAGSSWTLISGTVDRDGKKLRLIVPRLQGFLMFDANSHFLMVITHFGHSRFASKNSWEQTPGEGHAIWQRSVACFGRYSINQSDHTIGVHIDASTFPKWVGTEPETSIHCCRRQTGVDQCVSFARWEDCRLSLEASQVRHSFPSQKPTCSHCGDAVLPGLEFWQVATSQWTLLQWNV